VLRRVGRQARVRPESLALPAVAIARHRLDKAARSSRSQYLTERRNVLNQIAFIREALGPETPEDLGLTENMSFIFNK